jgi:hypothetical protein
MATPWSDDASAACCDACSAVRISCKEFKSDLAFVDEAAAESFASSIDIAAVKAFCFSGEGLSTNRFSELTFPSAEDEAGFIFIAHALDLGSGFRPQLHKHRGGQGAWLSVRAGLVNMGRANPSCPAAWLCSLTQADIQIFFDLIHPELEPLARYIHEDIQEIGEKLTRGGFSTPGEFVTHHVAGGAGHLVDTFVQNFPLCFRDEYVIRKQRVCFFKKAQLVVSELYMRFASEIPAFNFSDVDNMTAFVDNVVVAMMRMTGITKTADSLAAAISSGTPILKGSEEEVALRSASLTAVELIVAALAGRCQAEPPVFDCAADRLAYSWSTSSPHINAQMVCNWLWGCVGKDGDNRKYARHLSPSTSYY